MTQEKVADSWIEIECFRLLVLRTAWLIDKHKDYKKVRKDIAAVKIMLPRSCTTSRSGPCASTARSACRTRCRS